ncbi:ATP-binding protein [Paenibacillus massiliensis]|uniref:ATP-binding protein n=1 Tax=Paenibacillus massiliensis TaxID=225917 RepID=UPI0003FE3B13|nr:ATP-binding protein [Paenibacillus massiliensis]
MSDPSLEIQNLRKIIEDLSRQIVTAQTEQERVLSEFSGMNNELVNLQRKLTKSNSELKQARMEAERANQAKSTFLAMVSHEIRTPMNGMLGLTEVLLAEELPAAQRESIQWIQESGKLLLDMVNNLLDLSKIEAGEMKLQATSINLQDMMKQVTALLEVQAAQKGNVISTELEQGVETRLIGDAARLTQVLLNLLGNANKFTVAGQLQIKIRLLENSDEQQRLRFEVSDTGIGISEADQSILFQPYTQTVEGQTSPHGGTGLGLWISKLFVEMMGGQIGCISVEQEGATFWIELVLRKASDPELHPTHATKAGAPAELTECDKMDTMLPILVVEDQLVNRKVIGEQLRRLGLKELDFAVSGEEAVEYARSRHYGCILMDLHLPKLDGYAAAAHIRAHEQQSQSERIPIIALSGSSGEEERSKGASAGIDDFLQKPASIHLLREKLQHWLPQAAPEEALIDEEVIRDIMALDEDGSTELLASLLEIYKGDTPYKLQRLIGLLEQEEFDPCVYNQILEAAHELKSGSLSLGIKRMSIMFADIEQAARDRKLSTVKPVISKLEPTYHMTCTALEAFL